MIKIIKLTVIIHLLFYASFIDLYGQAIGIGANVFVPDASAMLEVQATNRGILIPRVSLTGFTDNTTIPNPATSLLVYNAGAAIPVGYYYNAGTPAAPQWVRLLDQRNAWLLTGNLGTDPATNFLGTTDAQPLIIRTNNLEQMRILSTGQVGIGLTAPTQRLVVAGNIGLQSGGNAFVGTLDNFALSLRTNNTDRVFITNTGNVGIGTTSPATQLHTIGTVRFANYASGASGAVLRTNSLGDLAITNFTGVATDVLLGTGTFGSMNALAWMITGNSGTTPATNFLGTTDNQHLAIRTNNTERMRFQDNGQIVVNATTAFSTYLFDIRGSTTFANPLYVSTPVATGTGIVVENYATAGSSTGSAIWGVSSQTGWATAAFGLRSTSAYTNTAISGITDATVSGGVGIIGRCDNTTGIGVAGLNLSTTANINATGVWGSTTNPRGSGVFGTNTSTTSNADATGVWGQTSNPAGRAGYFINAATTGTSTGNGVIGMTSQSQGFGVIGRNLHTSGTGVIGAGNNATALYLVGGSGGAFTGTTTGALARATNATGSTGLVASGNNISPFTLTDGSGGAFTGATTGVFGYANNASGDVDGGYFTIAGGGALARVASRIGATNYKVYGTGSVSTIVDKPAGGQAIMFCPEAPEIWFMDAGDGQLVNGRATITFDPIFSHNIHVDQKHPLRVFIQLEGDCNGVYVTNKTQYGFEVVELQGGKSNVPFTWQAIAVRADSKDEQGNITSKHVGLRFPDAPKPREIAFVESKTIESHEAEIKSEKTKTQRTVELTEPVKLEAKEIKLKSTQ